MKLASNLTLPAEVVTETEAIIGKRGSGKTTTARKIAEGMVKAHGAQIVVVDPLDAWYGLRSSADGKQAGLPVYVFGGAHADVPLEAEAGELLADLIVDEGISAVFSLRHLSKAKARLFVAVFCERLYHRKGEVRHRTPLHVFIDEADAFVPQRVSGESARSYGAIDDLVRRGRSSGIGVTLISQRPAVVAKDVLSQAEILIAHQVIGPHDRKALDEWISSHDTGEHAPEFRSTVSSLAVGEAWVWSPALLDVFKRVRVDRPVTFDSSSTPRPGVKKIEPGRRSEVDLVKLGERIAATVERARENDPKALKSTIARLERELSAAKSAPVEPMKIEVATLPAGLREALAHLRSMHEAERSNLQRALADLGAGFGLVTDSNLDTIDELIAGVLEEFERKPDAPDRTANRRTAGVRIAEGIESKRPEVEQAARRIVEQVDAALTPGGSATVEYRDSDVKIGKAHRAILGVLAQLGPRTKAQVCLLTGYSKKSSHTDNVISACRVAGWLVGSGAGPFEITAAGIVALGDDFERAPEPGPALVDYWRAKVGGGKVGEFFDLIAEAYPGEISKVELVEKTASGSRSSHTDNCLSKLRTLGLIEGSASLRLSNDLMQR